MNLEFLPASAITAEATKEIEDFLDSRSRSDLDIFQYPHWSPEGLCAIYRLREQISWFSLVSTVYPVGIQRWIKVADLGRGPLCDDVAIWHEGCMQLAGKLMRDGYAYMHMQPTWTEEPQFEASHGSTWKKSDSGRCTLRLQLDRSDEELLQGFRKTTRYNIRRALREGVQVDTAKCRADVREYLRIYQRLEKERLFGIKATHVNRRIHWLLDSGRGTLLLAWHEGRLMGGAVLARTGRLCTYVWGATTKTEQFSAGHLLQWRALQWAKSAGCTEYDFGNYWPGATQGPYWFKAGFGGNLVHSVATRYMPLSPLRCQIIFQSQRLKNYTQRLGWPKRAA
jgi:hypothetical protein